MKIRRIEWFTDGRLTGFKKFTPSINLEECVLKEKVEMVKDKLVFYNELEPYKHSQPDCLECFARNKFDNVKKIYYLEQ